MHKEDLALKKPTMADMPLNPTKSDIFDIYV